MEGSRAVGKRGGRRRKAPPAAKAQRLGFLRHRHLALAARLLIGVIFIVSAGAKLVFPAEFVRAIYTYDLLPIFAVEPAAFAVSWLELLIGVFLVAGLFTRVTAAVAAVLMVGFMGLMGVALAQGKTIDCGCFVGIIRETVGPSTIIRDALMLALLPPIFLAPVHRLSLDTRLRMEGASPLKNLSVAAFFTLVVIALGLAIANIGSALVASPPSAEAPSSSGLTIGRPDSGWRLGPANAAVEIVVFSDFECPGCQPSLLA